MTTRQLAPNRHPQSPGKDPDKKTRALINAVTSKFAVLQDTLLLGFTLCMLIEEYLKGKKKWLKSSSPTWREKQENAVLSLSTIDRDLVQVTSNLMCLCALIYPAVKVK